MPPKLEAVFFATASGKEPVRDWLLRLDREERRAVGSDIAYVQWKWPLGRPRVDHLREGVWEVRSTLGDRIARVLFAVSGNEMILLHAFFKKSQVIPPAELRLASARWKEWKHAEGE
jgi:phage-related protein